MLERSVGARRFPCARPCATGTVLYSTVPVQYRYSTGKKTPGGAGTHARDTRAHTGTRITQAVQRQPGHTLDTHKNLSQTNLKSNDVAQRPTPPTDCPTHAPDHTRTANAEPRDACVATHHTTHPIKPGGVDGLTVIG